MVADLINGKKACGPLIEKVDFFAELNDIYSAYVKGYENEIDKSKIVVYSVDFDDKRGNRLYIPQFYNMYIMPFNRFNEPLMRNALDLRIATIWCDNRNEERKPLNLKTKDYLSAHYLNLFIQMDGFNPFLLYPNFKTRKSIAFDKSKMAVPDSLAKEFVEKDYWGKLVISVGEKLGEL